MAEEEAELQIFERHMMRGWPHTSEALEMETGKYWLIRHELTMIHGITMMSKSII